MRLDVPGQGTGRAGRNPAALLLYILLVVIFYSPVIFAGKSLQPSLYQPHGVTEKGLYEDDSSRTPVNSFNVDIATPAYYEFPVNRLVGDLYRGGELPLWNPYQAGGTPLAAQYSSRAFFPYQILEDISPAWTWDFFLLGRLLIAGFFTYLFISALGLSFPASVAGGAFYMLSGTFVWFINLEQLVNVAMMVPIVMYAAERLARTGATRARESLAEVAFFGITVGMTLLAGQPEVALYVSLLAFLYYLVRAAGALRGAQWVVYNLKFLSSYVLGLLLALPLILPFLELVRSGYHIHPVGGDMGTQKLDNWQSVFAYLTPTVTEFPTNPEMINGVGLLVRIKDSFFRFLPINGVWDTLGGYTGATLAFVILTGVLYALARTDFRLRRYLFFFGGFGLAIILKNTGLPPFVWIGYIPMFDQVWTLRWAAPAWAFAFAVAGAISLELISARRPGKKPGPSGAPKTAMGRYFLARPHMAPTAAFLFMLVFYVMFSFIQVVDLTLNREIIFPDPMVPFVVPSMFMGHVLTVVFLAGAFVMAFAVLKGNRYGALLGLAALTVVELWWAVPRGYDERWLAYKLIPLAVGFVAVALYFMDRKKEAAVGVAAFLVAAFALDALSPHGFPDRRDPYAESPFVEFLRENIGHHRASGGYGVLFPNFSSALGIKDLRYVNSILPATFQSFRKDHLHVDSIDEGPSSGLWFSGRPERCKAVTWKEESRRLYDFWLRPTEEDVAVKLRNYSLLGLKYLVLPRDTRYGIHERALAFEPYSLDFLPVVYDGEVRVHENPWVLPRVFVAFGYEVAPDFESAQARAAEADFDARRTAVLEKDVGIPAEGEGDYTAEITEYNANSVAVDVTASSPGILVLTDVHYPGWKALVNGRPGEVLRVDGVVRGVVVPAGESRVEFVYRPVTFTAGSMAFFAAAGFCLFAFVRTRKGREGS